MNLVAKSGVLASALSLAAAAVRKKGVVRLVADDGSARVTCGDNAIASTATASATVHEPGQVAVSADRLAALVAGFAPGEPVTLSTTGSMATIVCGNTRLTRVFTGRPARALHNRLIDEMGDAEALEFPAQASLTRRLWQGKSDAALQAFLPLWAGQAVPLIRDLPAATLINTLVAESRGRLPSG
jgi:Nitronate monooxygenase